MRAVLARAMNEPDAGQRHQVMEVLSHASAPKPPQTEQLLQMLHSENAAEMTAAAEALGKLDAAEPRVAPALIGVLRPHIEQAVPGDADLAGAACRHKPAEACAEIRRDPRTASPFGSAQELGRAAERLAPALAAQPQPSLLAALQDLSRSTDAMVRINARSRCGKLVSRCRPMHSGKHVPQGTKRCVHSKDARAQPRPAKGRMYDAGHDSPARSRSGWTISRCGPGSRSISG